MNFDSAFSNCQKLSKVYYRMSDYPTNRQDIGTRKIHFYARIDSLQGKNHCGDVEVNAYQNFCSAILHTNKRRSFNFFGLPIYYIFLIAYS